MKLVAAVLLGLLSTSALAQTAKDAVMLRPFDGESTIDITKSLTVHGKCGDAVIRLTGIKPDRFNQDDYYAADPSVDADLVVIRGNGKDISHKALLSDYNTVHCVNTKQGPLLVVGSSCSGSACGDQKHYRFVDVKTGKLVPKTPEACDESCVNKFVGFKHFK